MLRRVQEYQSIDIKIFESVLLKCRFYVARLRAQQLLYSDSFLKQTNVPLQVLPSPVYPALHAHAYDPTVLVQTALTSHLWSLVEHSSTSENINYSKYKKYILLHDSWVRTNFYLRAVKNQKRKSEIWASKSDCSKPENKDRTKEPTMKRFV